MEKTKESKLVIYGVCSKCDNLVKINVHLSTEAIEPEPEKKPEEAKPNAEQENPEPAENAGKSEPVRPDSAEGKPPSDSTESKPADTGKSAGAKKARGK